MTSRVRPVLLVALVLAAPAAFGQDPATGVREAFLGYKTSILASDGKAAVQHVSRSTIDYFGEMQQLALYGKAADVRGQSAVNRLQILAFRHRLQPAQVKEMSASQIFVHGVDNGWIGKQSVLAAQPGAIEVSGETGSVELLQGTKPTGQKFLFVREDGRWRLDLVPVLATGNTALRLLATRQGLSEDDLILGLLESVSGRKVPATVWEPLFSR